MGAMIVALIVCVSMILLILFKPSVRVGHIQLSVYWMAPLAGAILMTVLGYVSPTQIIQGLTADSEVNPIKILILFLSMTLISVFLDNTGFFGFLAMKALQKAKSSQKTMLLLLYSLVSVLTVFTSNDIIVLTFTPFICYFSKKAKINPLPFLITEFIAANTWSMMLIIGNPTNIYLCGSVGVQFAEYIGVMVLPTVLSGLLSLTLLFVMFRKSLSAPISCDEYLPVKTDNPLMILSLVFLGCAILLMAISSYCGLPMWIISFACFLLLYVIATGYLIVRHRPFTPVISSLKRTPYEIIPFVLSMFVIVLALGEAGVTKQITDLLSGANPVISYGISSMCAANLVNNIPMSVLFSTVIEPLSGIARTQALYAAVVGSNLGAFLTPIGALAGIMWMDMLRAHDVNLSFGRFTLHCAPIAVIALVGALAGLLIVL